MSAKPKTSDERIREVARRLIEEQGAEHLSMQAVADAVGVKAPSLYKRYASRADLLRAVTRGALAELQDLIEKAVRPGSARRSLERMAAALRAFAKKNPGAYKLIFAEGLEDQTLLDARLASAAPLLRVLQEAIGKQRALLGARTLVAFLYGFVTMEMGGMFRLGGNVDQAFRYGLAAILDALLNRAAVDGGSSGVR